MLKDTCGAAFATESSTAVCAFDRARQAFLRHRPGVAEDLDLARTADADFAGAHAFLGLLQILQAREDTLALAVQSARRARRAADSRPCQAMELALVEALEAAAGGRWRAAAHRLEHAIDPDRPHPLPIKLAHALRFLCGDRSGMLALTEPLAARSEPFPGFGFVLGCHAFALEENGHFEKAEEAAQRALHFSPDDTWAMHALAHVYEACNRSGEGLLWVESGRQAWSQCNNFAHHMAWHLALFHVERGKYDRALAIYDRELRYNLGEDFRDAANAVSLLVRMRHIGLDTGDRMDELHALAMRRASDASCAFASLHYLLVLLERGDFPAARALLAAMREQARDATGDQGAVSRDIGAPLAEALIGFAEDNRAAPQLPDLARALPDLGGSFAQRDIFLQTLILMADSICDYRTTGTLIALRQKMRRADAFAQLIEKRRCFGGVEGQNVA